MHYCTEEQIGEQHAEAKYFIYPPHDLWLKALVESKEFASKSDVVNALIRKARENEAIRARLIQAEQSEFTHQSSAEILAETKGEARRNGEL